MDTESTDPLERVDYVFGPFADHQFKIRDNPCNPWLTPYAWG